MSSSINLLFFILPLGPVQIIYRSPARSTILYNDAVISRFDSLSFSLRCVTLNSHENPRWSTDNSELAGFLLSAQQSDAVQIGTTNVTLRVQNSREQELQFSGVFDMQLSGNYSCVSQTSRQSANLVLITGKLYDKVRAMLYVYNRIKWVSHKTK